MKKDTWIETCTLLILCLIKVSACSYPARGEIPEAWGPVLWVLRVSYAIWDCLDSLRILKKLWPVFHWSSQPVPSEISLRKLPYHFPPLRKFPNFCSNRKYPSSQLSYNQWVVLVFRWRRMEDTCRKTRLEPSRDSLPRQANYESMHRASVLYSESTFNRRGYTLWCVSRMWVSSVGWHAVKRM